ncbi:MAG: SDR family NAD(P)-dependent oxidoreductase [Candidatus Brocadiia bacterium]
MADRVAFVTGADRGLGHALAAGLLEKGWIVCAGQFMPEWPELDELGEEADGRLHSVPLDVTDEQSVARAADAVRDAAGRVDLLVNNAGVISPVMGRTIREEQDYAEMHRLFDVNAVGPLHVVQAFLPLMDEGGMRRLCFVSSEAGSIGRCTRRAWFSYCMSKAALNMAVKILFNDLRPDGFTFRLYHPGWMRTYMSGEKNLEADLEPEEAAAAALDYFLGACDEDRLVMRDNQGREWPW